MPVDAVLSRERPDQSRRESSSGSEPIRSVAVLPFGNANNNSEMDYLGEGAYEQRSASIPYLAIEPAFEGIRSDPRYADLLRRVGLPQ